jgi:hypothetical protein
MPASAGKKGASYTQENIYKAEREAVKAEWKDVKIF